LAVLPDSDYVGEEEDCGFGVGVVGFWGGGVGFDVGGDFYGLAGWGASGEEMLARMLGIEL
jgi:hypothetical protein